MNKTARLIEADDDAILAELQAATAKWAPADSTAKAQIRFAQVEDGLPKLTNLAAAPRVGKIYLVPTIRAPFYGLWGDWAVRGPQHQELPDGMIDWHLDRRFMTKAQERKLVELERAYVFERGDTPNPGDGRRWPGSRVGAYFTFLWLEEGVSTGNDVIDQLVLRGKPPPATLLPRKCRRPTVEVEDMPEYWDLAERYGEPAEPIWSKDGRPLCPHQKVDLTGEPCDSDGVVTCPLHRLRVRCRPPLAACPHDTVDI